MSRRPRRSVENGSDVSKFIIVGGIVAVIAAFIISYIVYSQIIAKRSGIKINNTQKIAQSNESSMINIISNTQEVTSQIGKSVNDISKNETTDSKANENKENKTNNEIMKSLRKELKENSQGVPFTIFGAKTFLGYDESFNERIENAIDSYLNENTDTNNSYTIPILGKIEAKNASIILIAIILGFIDGFNPCAMWILLLLINMCISIKDKKKMLIVCLTFIITSGIIYFLSMLGIGFILDLTTIAYIRNIIAVLAIVLGIYNLYTYIKTRKETGCHVVKKEKILRTIFQHKIV